MSVPASTPTEATALDNRLAAGEPMCVANAVHPSESDEVAGRARRNPALHQFTPATPSRLEGSATSGDCPERVIVEVICVLPSPRPPPPLPPLGFLAKKVDNSSGFEPLY